MTQEKERERQKAGKDKDTVEVEVNIHGKPMGKFTVKKGTAKEVIAQILEQIRKKYGLTIDIKEMTISLHGKMIKGEKDADITENPVVNENITLVFMRKVQGG